jgi:hypothetical protein
VSKRRKPQGSAHHRVRKFAHSLEPEAEQTSDLAASVLVDYVTELGAFSDLEPQTRFEQFHTSFKSLEPEPRAQLAALIVRAALGEDHTFRWYTRETVELLHALCLTGSADEFVPHRSTLEQTFKPDRLKRWSRNRHSRAEPRGLAFMTTWHYAIRLWHVLYLLHSPVAREYLGQLLRLRRTARGRPLEHQQDLLEPQSKPSCCLPYSS